MTSERHTDIRIEVALADAEATAKLGERLGARLRAGQGLALVGDLGAGKTTLTRGVALGLGLDDPGAVTSPTYLIAVEHPGPTPLIHVDAYLPEKTRGFLLDGGVDYLGEQGAVLVVEWADRIADLLPGPADTLWVRLEHHADGGRVAVLEAGPNFRWLLDFGSSPGSV